MGENPHLPPENGSQKQNGEGSHGENEETEDFEDMTAEEFHTLDSQLDALNLALDDIEQKNDNIHERLLQLLQSNREIRKQIQESNAAAIAAAADPSQEEQNGRK